MTASPAVRRVLRDIDEGHINLYVEIERFDPQTGARHDPPRITTVAPDRAVSGTIPNARGAWWQPMLAAGWLELDDRGRAARLVSAAGLAIAGGSR